MTSVSERRRVVRPLFPWDRWDDGEPVGWDVALTLWRHFLLPYRTALYLGYDRERDEFLFDRWFWHRPDVLLRD